MTKSKQSRQLHYNNVVSGKISSFGSKFPARIIQPSDRRKRKDKKIGSAASPALHKLQKPPDMARTCNRSSSSPQASSLIKNS